MTASDLSNEELATIMRGLKHTGVTPTKFEQECLEEVATRVEYLDVILERIKTLTEHLETTNKLYCERVDKECIL